MRVIGATGNHPSINTRRRRLKTEQSKHHSNQQRYKQTHLLDVNFDPHLSVCDHRQLQYQHEQWSRIEERSLMDQKAFEKQHRSLCCHCGAGTCQNFLRVLFKQK